MRQQTSLAVLGGLVLVTATALAGCSVTTSPEQPVAVVEGSASAPNLPAGTSNASSVATVQQLVSLINSAYGEARLGLHRGHQPVESVLDTVLGISHDELHARMDAGKNLATIANELGVGQEKLVTALVDSWAVSITSLVDAGTITEADGLKYRAALTEAFTFRVTWNGSDATPTFSGISVN
jgi:hypothetical protein